MESPPMLNDEDCTVVVAAHAPNASTLALVRFLFPSECEIEVFDKATPACKFMPLAGISSCVSLPNVGKEQHTYAYYVRSTYDALPKYIFFVPGVLDKHARVHSIQVMLNETIFSNERPGGMGGHGFWCINQTSVCDSLSYAVQLPMRLSNCGACQITSYPEGNRTVNFEDPGLAAMPHTLLPWLQQHVDRFTNGTMDRLCHMPLCHYGVAATTRENLRAHPAEVYADIEGVLGAAYFNEPTMYMEWAMAPTFGTLMGSGGTSCAGAPLYNTTRCQMWNLTDDQVPVWSSPEDPLP